MTDVFVLDAVRAPIGRYGGALSGTRPDDLAAHVLGSLVARTPGPDPANIEEVFFGDANGAGEDNRESTAVRAIGHPLGASGARIVTHLAHALHARGGGYGLAAICIGVGQGLAVVLEGVA